MRARDARSGSSRDFFLERRDLWTRWDEGEGEPPRMGEAVRLAGESWRFSERSAGKGALLCAALEAELPMLGAGRGGGRGRRETGRKGGGATRRRRRRRARRQTETDAGKGEGDRIPGSVTLISRLL